MKSRIVFCIVLSIVISVALFVPVGEYAFAAADNDGILLPVLMYHSVLKSKNGTYIVSPAQFEEDLRKMTEAGYTTVFPSEIIAYSEGNGTLPEKPVLITFDDGHYNNMFYALPILQKYSAKAVINVIGAFSEYSTTSGDDSNPNYSHLTWSQIGELAQSGCFEIGNHTYNMHKYKPRFGVMPIDGESKEEHENNLTNDIMRLQTKIEESTGYAPTVFAYPFGKYNSEIKSELKEMGFKMLLTCNEGVNVIRRNDADALLRLKRINRSGKYSTDTVLSKMHGAKD